MNAIIQWIDGVVASVPLEVLEAWGRLAYLVGIVPAIVAFGGFTFRPGGRWRLGRERPAWDAKAVLSIPAADAEEALVVLRDWRPRMILLDLHMPGMGGLELARRLKADPSTQGF